MLAKTYSDVRNNLKSVCDTITNNDESVIVTGKNDNNKQCCFRVYSR